jgi:quercetin dioxygenase-like cupin family protein
LSTGDRVELAEVLASTGEQAGVIWSLQNSGDLNANLVHFGAGEGVREHVNDEVDVLVIGVSGSGEARVNDTSHRLFAGTLIFIPKGARRSTRGASGDFAYVSIHRRRGPLEIGGKRRGERSEE